jgi:isoquinoline 1-oxidoreductase beta subunit
VAGNIQSKSTGLLPVGRVFQGYLGGADLSPQVLGAGNVLLDSISIPAPVTLGTARSVDSYPGAFFLQGFIDELALAARQDPYDFQRSLLEPRRVPAHLPDRDVMVAKMLRWRNVLDAVVAHAEWKRTLGPGRGRGLSIFQHGETCTAAVCEVRLEADGILTVERVVFAADPGNVLNPLGAKAQIEGGIIFGLTSALYGRITVEKGRVVEGNFNAYRLMRMNEAPLIEVHLVPSGGFWGGLGEVGVPTMAPSLTNAIVNAGGPRIRNLPILSNNLARRA